jgi:hypothetical protein
MLSAQSPFMGILSIIIVTPLLVPEIFSRAE